MGHDVIIVGAGAAGCVLAARLSEDPARSVLLVEAGPDYPDPAMLPPAIASSHNATTVTHDWGYTSAGGGLGRTMRLPRGKLVGGSSATNGAAAVRGLPGDYDEWAARGNPGWAFADVLPFFRRLEHDYDVATEWHGHDGPLPIRRYTEAELTLAQRAFLEACVAAGYPRVADHNAPGAMGVGMWPMNRVGSRKQSAALAYLQPARARPNLTVRGDALVDRVLFASRRATGARLAGAAEDLQADRVILAAGAYASPAILLRSGIGPADDLRGLGIAVVEDRPGVGRQLRDHVAVNLRFAVAPQPPAGDIPRYQILLTLPSAPGRGGYDLQIFPASIGTALSHERAQQGELALVVALVKPESVGDVRLRSVDPTAAPVIDGGYLSHAADLPRLVVGVRAARQVVRTAPLAALVLREEVAAGQGGDDEAALAALVRARAGTFHHPVGTCRMGPATDPGAVVDARGNVYGAEGLSVVDASIMPVLPAMNTHLPTLMLAERCVAWITGGA